MRHTAMFDIGTIAEENHETIFAGKKQFCLSLDTPNGASLRKPFGVSYVLCIRLTGEGIRPALFFSEACGQAVRRVLEGKLPLDVGLTGSSIASTADRTFSKVRPLFMVPNYLAGIPRLYRYLAPIYPTLRPFWTGTLTRRAEQYLEQVVLPIALHPRAKVLDLGCGPGSNLARLRRLSLPFDRYVGLDLSPAMLAKCRATFPATVEFILGDTHWLPFADASFDVILSTWMFSHLPQPRLVVRQAERLLRPGGWLIIVCFAKPAGLPGTLLRLVEPAFQMHSLPMEEIQTWHDLIETKNFLGGINVIARLQKQISTTYQH